MVNSHIFSRSKKLSVLIHNSTSHTNVPWCRVAVHFQEIIDKGGEDFEVVPNSQFCVSRWVILLTSVISLPNNDIMLLLRTANKDNSSFYSLNGKRAQYKEVAKLLRDKGIDLDHNRFLILQVNLAQYFCFTINRIILILRAKLRAFPSWSPKPWPSTTRACLSSWRILSVG